MTQMTQGGRKTAEPVKKEEDDEDEDEDEEGDEEEGGEDECAYAYTASRRMR